MSRVGGGSFHWAAAAFRFLESGLERSKGQCVWCGGRCAAAGWRTTGRYPRLPGLCGACQDAIPWIDRIACAGCGRSEACPDCTRRTQPALLANRSAVRYTPLMKEWLARYKYRGAERLSPLFQGMLAHAYNQLREEWRAQERRRAQTVLAYVPLSRERLHERGFNQAGAMASGLGRRFRAPVLPLLVRRRHTGKQSEKSRRERLSSLERAFTVDSNALRQLSDLARRGPVNVVIADDVYTTGNTLHRCAEALAAELPAMLRCGPVKIYGVTWAR